MVTLKHRWKQYVFIMAVTIMFGQFFHQPAYTGYDRIEVLALTFIWANAIFFTALFFLKTERYVRKRFFS